MPWLKSPEFINTWATHHNPFFDGPNADWLALIPFAFLAAYLCITGRQHSYTPSG